MASLLGDVAHVVNELHSARLHLIAHEDQDVGAARHGERLRSRQGFSCSSPGSNLPLDVDANLVARKDFEDLKDEFPVNDTRGDVGGFSVEFHGFRGVSFPVEHFEGRRKPGAVSFFIRKRERPRTLENVTRFRFVVAIGVEIARVVGDERGDGRGLLRRVADGGLHPPADAQHASPGAQRPPTLHQNCPQIVLKTHHEMVRNRAGIVYRRDDATLCRHAI